MGGSQPGGDMGRGLPGRGKPVVTHTPELNGLWGFGRGASKEVPHPGVDLFFSFSGFCSGMAKARGQKPGEGSPVVRE